MREKKIIVLLKTLVFEMSHSNGVVDFTGECSPKVIEKDIDGGFIFFDVEVFISAMEKEKESDDIYEREDQWEQKRTKIEKYVITVRQKENKFIQLFQFMHKHGLKVKTSPLLKEIIAVCESGGP